MNVSSVNNGETWNSTFGYRQNITLPRYCANGIYVNTLIHWKQPKHKAQPIYHRLFTMKPFKINLEKLGLNSEFESNCVTRTDKNKLKVTLLFSWNMWTLITLLCTCFVAEIFWSCHNLLDMSVIAAFQTLPYDN